MRITYNKLAYQDANSFAPEQPAAQVPCIADNDNLINILLVEDNVGDSLLTVQRIKSTQVPYRIDCIMHGDDVLPYLRNCMQSRLPDIIFLDMGLPGINGFELLETLNEAPAALRAIPIVIITGYRDFDYLSATYNSLPIYGYLTKPLRTDDITPFLAKVTSFKQTEDVRLQTSGPAPSPTSTDKHWLRMSSLRTWPHPPDA